MVALRSVTATAPLSNWRLQVVAAGGGDAAALFSDASADSELDAAISPDGKRVAYVSDRDSEDGDVDLWVAELTTGYARTNQTRASDAGARDGGLSVVVAGRRAAGILRTARRHRFHLGCSRRSADTGPVDAPPRPRPSAPPQLVSRYGGAPAWSPDGRKIAIAEFPPADPSYNGNPLRNDDEPPPLFARDAFRLWIVDAPLPVDSGAQPIGPETSSSNSARNPVASAFRRKTFTSAFDRVWETLRRLYYSTGSQADEWRRLRDRHRPEAQAATDEAALETVIDTLVAAAAADQAGGYLEPGRRRLWSSTGFGGWRARARTRRQHRRCGHRHLIRARRRRAGRLGHRRRRHGGALSEGDARAGRHRLQGPGADSRDRRQPAAAAEHRRWARGGEHPGRCRRPRLPVSQLWQQESRRGQDLLAPAIEHAENGFVLDQALPTSIVEGRRFFDKYPESRRIYLPGGRVPRPADRFSNKDYAATLRSIAKGGADAFYRGDIARRIAADMAKNGGLITLDDLAQYRAIERRPLTGRYRDHVVFSVPPPVSSGLGLIETLQILENYRPKPGASYTTRCRLPALRHRGLEGARSQRPHRGSGAVGCEPRTASGPGARGDALQADRFEERITQPAGAGAHRSA